MFSLPRPWQTTNIVIVHQLFLFYFCLQVRLKKGYKPLLVWSYNKNTFNKTNTTLKEHVALNRSSWSLKKAKAVITEFNL